MQSEKDKLRFTCEFHIAHQIHYGNIIDFGSIIVIFMCFNTINVNVHTLLVLNRISVMFAQSNKITFDLWKNWDKIQR